MATNTTIPTDSDIRAAAIAKGFADASIVRQFVPDKFGALDAGDWHLLFVKFHEHADWELVGRRRTKVELLQLAQRKAGPAELPKREEVVANIVDKSN